MKGKVIARKTAQHVKNDEAATDDFQISIGHYHECLAEDFVQGDHYARYLDGLEDFPNNYVPNQYETYEEAYNGKNVMLDVDDYVNNAEYAEAVAV